MGFVGSSRKSYQGIPNRCKDNPIVEIRKDESEAKGEGWIVDNEVGLYTDSWHISRDQRCIRMTSQATRLSTLMKTMLKREGSEDKR